MPRAPGSTYLLVLRNVLPVCILRGDSGKKTLFRPPPKKCQTARGFPRRFDEPIAPEARSLCYGNA